MIQSRWALPGARVARPAIRPSRCWHAAFSRRPIISQTSRIVRAPPSYMAEITGGSQTLRN
jgi:hypothetical protein